MNAQSIHLPRSRTVTAIVTVLAMIFTLAAFNLSAPDSAEAAPPDGKGQMEPKLVDQFKESGGEAQGFWVTFTQTADTSAAADIDEWTERGRYVTEERKRVAEQSQRAVRKRLDAQGVDYTPHWITNAIWIDNGTMGLASSLVGQDGVDQLLAPVVYEVPDPFESELADDKMGANAVADVEWGIANINADQVWETYGVRGDGIVVANVDTGVEWDHPALVNSYRGWNGDGTIDNDYNWFDATGNYADPADNNGHGTHTMGTMVGDDGGANRIGVAPGATWIAANGCATCASDDLIAASEWLLAPTRTDGSAADPAKRPHVINNSWGTIEPSNDPFMEDVQQAWADAGIFGVWSNGNNGPNCSTSGSPGSRTINYSVGAYDVDNEIASFSSRGPGQDGEVKPNIAAPGANVRSSYTDGRYIGASGTSMAAPHVAGAVALAWAADPTLVGDITTTRQLLDDTAIDTADDQCGGTVDDNNVWGEGRLDALALVEARGQADLGTVTGTVTNDSGDPVAGASIRMVDGTTVRSARTAADGTYDVHVPAGTYDATVTAFGHEDATTTITVTAGTTTTADVELVELPGFTVTGLVVDEVTGNGLPDVTVSIGGSIFSATTDLDGTFVMEGVHGPRDYVLTFDAGMCGDRPLTRRLSVVDTDVELSTVRMPRLPIDADENRNNFNNVVEGPTHQPYGYTCVTETSDWIAGDTPVELTQDPDIRDRTAYVDLPFEFRWFGWPTDQIRVQTGALGFMPSEAPFGDPGPTHTAQYLVADSHAYDRWEDSGIWTKMAGQAPNRTFTIEWRNYGYFNSGWKFDLAVTLHENGDVVMAANNIDPESLAERGAGIEVFVRSDGHGSPARWACCFLHYLTQGSTHSHAFRSNDTQVHLDLPDAGLVAGTVTNATTGDPVPNASVDVKDRFGRLVWRYRTDKQGQYRAEIFTGQDYTVSAIKPDGHPERSSATTVSIDHVKDTATAGLQLAAASPTVRQESVGLADGSGALTLSNDGRSDPWQWDAGMQVVDPNGPVPGQATREVELPEQTGVLTVAVEEHEGSWWTAEPNLLGPGNPYYVREYTTDGVPTGNEINMSLVEQHLGLPPRTYGPIDLAYIDASDEVCIIPWAVNDVAIACVQVATGTIRSIDPDIPDDHDMHGLAYDDVNDRMFVLHGTYGIGRMGVAVSTIAGPRHAQPGQELNTCMMYGINSNTLSYHPGSEALWLATEFFPYRGHTPYMAKVDPTTCIQTDTVKMNRAASEVAVPGRPIGTDITADGTMLSVAGWFPIVTEIESGDTTVQSLPWLDMSQTSGTQGKGKPTTIDFTVDQAAVPDGVDQVDLLLRGNSGPQDPITVPLLLTDDGSSGGGKGGGPKGTQAKLE